MSCIYGEVVAIARTNKQSFIPIAAPPPPTAKAPGQLVRRLNPLPVVGGWHLVVFAPRDRPFDAQLQPAGVPARCGGVRVELARSRSATNSPGYPTSATNAVSDFNTQKIGRA